MSIVNFKYFIFHINHIDFGWYEFLNLRFEFFCFIKLILDESFPIKVPGVSRQKTGNRQNPNQGKESTTAKGQSNFHRSCGKITLNAHWRRVCSQGKKHDVFGRSSKVQGLVRPVHSWSYGDRLKDQTGKGKIHCGVYGPWKRLIEVMMGVEII